jgi:hypothetical protein
MTASVERGTTIMRTRLGVNVPAVCFIVAASISGLAQAHENYSGHWQLDLKKSHIQRDAITGNASPAQTRLTITQTATTIEIVSDIGSDAFGFGGRYEIDSKPHVIARGAFKLTTISTWQGDHLATQTATTGAVATDNRELWSLDPSGKMLTIKRHATSQINVALPGVSAIPNVIDDLMVYDRN